MLISRLCFIPLLIGMLLIDAPATGAENSRNWPRIYTHGPGCGRYVALTFDDSPMPDAMELLDVLDELDVKATFFVNGLFAEWHPALLQEIASRGHEIGSHSYDHPDMTEVDDIELRMQFDLTNQLIRGFTGIIPHLFRPPGGHYDSRVVDAAYAHELTTALWTVNAADYADLTSSQIASRVLRGTRRGGIILMHDGIKATRNALPEIVQTLRRRGYTFVTVGDMLRLTHGECPWREYDEEGLVPIQILPHL